MAHHHRTWSALLQPSSDKPGNAQQLTIAEPHGQLRKVAWSNADQPCDDHEVECQSDTDREHAELDSFAGGRLDIAQIG